MKRASDIQAVRAREDRARHFGWAWLRNAVLGLAAVGCSALLGGCDDLMGNGAPQPGPQRPRSSYVDRKVGSTYEGIRLHPDGTYDRTVVDYWGRAYGQKGTWRGYGGVFQDSHHRIDRRLELDGYSEARDVVTAGGTQNVPKSTKTLSSGDFYMH